ncbi:MAG: M14 family metallopeptidase [bacterium]|nr:M14 family metallopeptidase [bacterium]
MLKKVFIVICVLWAFAFGKELWSNDWLTTPERTDYKKTSTYGEVMDFITQAPKRSALVRLAPLFTSTEGRMVPLLIVSKEGIATPGEMRLLGKPCLLINANIHAGEVEGKEAVQMLLREIVTGAFTGILENQVVLLIPIFNADGNDKFGNNRRDNGPPLAGVRYNGRHLDLNRDSIKLESPEMKALAKLLQQWDPVLMVDMHTTNGSYHREPVTYSTLLNPNSFPKLADYMWQAFFPAVAETLKKKYHFDSVPYGNWTDGTQPEKGWRVYAFAARYGTNYVGLRNRFSILNENYANADFKTRVLGSLGFIKAILLYTETHLRDMSKMVKEADIDTRDNYYKQSFALEFKNEKLMELDIKSYEFTVEKIKPEDKDKYPSYYQGVLVKPTKTHKTYRADYFSKAVPTKTISLPEAYILLPNQGEIARIMANHGVIVERIEESVNVPVENFVLDSVKIDRLYQGRSLMKVSGAYKDTTLEIPVGSYYVSMKQVLARLIPIMLEPQCEDSLLVWGFFNRVITSQWTGKPSLYPVYRLKKDVPMLKTLFSF